MFELSNFRLIMDQLPILRFFTQQHRFKFGDLLLELLLMIVYLFVHFPLSVDKHMTNELLHSRHHNLRLDFKVVLLSYDHILIVIIMVDHGIVFRL